MAGYLRAIIATVSINLLLTGVSAQSGKKTIFTDRNYKTVNRERDAAFIIDMWEKDDTMYFDTRSRNPKGKVESGKYPLNQGFDQRNCYLTRYWPDGTIRGHGQIRQSWNEGLWTFYDERGRLYSTVNYSNGLMNGIAKRFYPSGLIRTYTLTDNLKEGESLLFDTSGSIFTIENYSRDSLHGPVVEFFPGGNIKRKAIYNHGVIQKDTMFYESGQVFNAENYDAEGKLEGRIWIFTPSGKIARFDEYTHGVVIQSNCIHMLAGSDYDGDDCPPRFQPSAYPGGIEKYNEYVSINQEYPETAIKWKQQGVVTYEVKINDYGFVEDITEENLIPLGFGLEAESLRLLKKMKRFDPMKLNGKPMPSTLRIPFVFILREQ